MEWGDGSGGGVEGGFRGQRSGEGFGLSFLGRLDVLMQDAFHWQTQQ